MKRANSAGKVLLAGLSLLLAALIWGKGLQESFSRPSVAPQLSMRQQEISLLAAPSIPNSLKPFLIGDISNDATNLLNDFKVLKGAISDIVKPLLSSKVIDIESKSISDHHIEDEREAA